jgi:hypothetical protein
MSNNKSFAVPVIFIILTVSLFNFALADEKAFVEKSFGNQRHLYSVPCEIKGPFAYSNSPLEIQKTFNAPWDRVWAAVQKVIAAKNASILVSDQASGLLVFKYDFKPTSTRKDPIVGVFDRKVESPYAMQIYYNVLLKKGELEKNTIVYATYFIPRMTTPSNYFDVEFFRTLGNNL